MQTDEMITVHEFCIHHQVEHSFIDLLCESGLVEIIIVDEKRAVPLNQLPQLEKMVRFYYEMGINLEGIETITHLLKRMNEMQQEIIKFNNRLQLYENKGDE